MRRKPSAVIVGLGVLGASLLATGSASSHGSILAVWNIADTGNAFYACSDVQF
ncbi:hypothetical protein GCM10009753_41530 [Streptantibioticus ferralitis]